MFVIPLQNKLHSDQQDAQEVPFVQPEGRRARVHHVPASHHELPGKSREIRLINTNTLYFLSCHRLNIILLPLSPASTW